MPFLKRIAPYIKDLTTDHTGNFDEYTYDLTLVDPTHVEMITSLPLPQLRNLKIDSQALLLTEELSVLEVLLPHVGDQLQRLDLIVGYAHYHSTDHPCYCMLLHYCPQLKHLTYDILNYKLGTCVHGPQKVLHPLESLELVLERMSTADVLPLLHRCTQLRSLCMGTYFGSDIDLLRILDACPKLRTFGFVTGSGWPNANRDRLFWWGKHFVPCNNTHSSTSTPGLLNLIITNPYSHQFYTLNTIVNMHHQTIRLIEVAFNNSDIGINGRKHDTIHVAPPNLEKLDFHFRDFRYTSYDLACVIRPYLEQCSRLIWVSLKACPSSNLLPLPHWAFVALAQLSDLRHFHIQMAHDPNDMVYFLNAIKSHNNTKLESLLYEGDWVSNIDVIRLIAEIPSLRSLELRLPASIDHVRPKAMIDCLQILQHAPRIQSLSFVNVNGFSSYGVFLNMGLMPHLQQLYIITFASINKEGIRHIADREPPLKRLMVRQRSVTGQYWVSDVDLKDALKYARTKIKIVEGVHSWTF